MKKKEQRLAGRYCACAALAAAVAIGVVTCNKSTPLPHDVGDGQSAPTVRVQSAAPAEPASWIGRGNGSEGRFLQIMPAARRGHFKLAVQDDPDTRARYDAIARADALPLERGTIDHDEVLPGRSAST